MDDPKFRSQIEVLSVVDKGRRRDWTDAEKVRIVEESLRGYRQCAATARRYEISRALLTRWRRDFRSGHLVADGRPQFMAVQVASDAANSAARQPQESPTSSINDRVEITLANGRKLAVGATLDPMMLGRLVQVLDRA
jgi:transposase